MRGGHAADGKEFLDVDAAFFGVEKFIADVEAFDQADDHAVAADLESAPFGAFQAGGSLGYARGFHKRRGCGVEAGVEEFIFTVGQGCSALIHGFGNGFIHEVDDEFVAGADIQRGVLGRTVIAIAGGEGADGRVGAHEIEKAERGGVDLTAVVDGGDERYGPGRDQAGEDWIGAVGILVFEVKFHDKNIRWKAKSEKS